MIVQIYEIQTPREARELVDLGVDHIGSVLENEAQWNAPAVKAVVEAIRNTPAKSSIIPLFNRPEAVARMVAFHQPDIVHFCEDLLLCEADTLQRVYRMQEKVRNTFPRVALMRTIPVPASGQRIEKSALSLARRFESLSDFFLADTHVPNSPVAGFAGITGKPCDWETAAALVRQSGIPVILAGGLGPENVAAAIVSTAPAGVDSCTGTNARDAAGLPIRFQKDLKRVERFVNAARRAQQDLAAAAGVKNTA
jgi:phosphoribosylanthranilate isomerase